MTAPSVNVTGDNPPLVGLHEASVAPAPLPPVTEVSTARVHIDPANCRKVFYELDSLVSSIAKDGILQPPLLWEDSERDCMFTIFGNRRVLAAQKLGLVTIPARVLSGPLSQREKGRYQLIENLQRIDLKVSEEGHAFRELADDGMTGREIAAMLSIHETRVSRKLTLLKLAPPLLALVDAGMLTEGVGLHLAHLAPDAQLELAERLGDICLCKPETVKAAVQQQTGKKARSTADRMSCKFGDIAFSVSAPTPMTWDSLLDAVDRFRKEAKTLRDSGQDVTALSRPKRAV